MAARYAIGIDLGTTNCSLASAPLSAESAQPEAFKIQQVVNAGEVAARELLPSFLYLPSTVELPAGALALPWEDDAIMTIGTFARDRGAGTPTRLVASAKSWLSHTGIDRRARVLPWGADPNEIPQVSPFEASAMYLQHLRLAWDSAHPEAPLEDQDVVLTVPASFDAVARELTLEAAHAAGFSESIRLLEEPQAALYAWVADHGASWRKQVEVGDTILVCDVGGGTTDFSLIKVREEGGQLQLERIAVGDHILLGGDNMDLALAYTVNERLKQQGRTLDEWQLRALTHGCRQAKEGLLADLDKPSWPLVVPGRGSRLIGGSIRAELRRAELEAVLVQGFFPEVPASARPQQRRRLGLATLGLPYAQDAGITRHLAAFLAGAALQHPAGHSFVHPSAILFNGGVTRSPLIRSRVRELVTAWVAAEGGAAPRILEGVHPDLSVCRGAAYYAHARTAGGVRIRGGTARAYYVGIERGGLAVPGVPVAIDAVCIAPFGMEEGSEVELAEPFGLYVGQEVGFEFFGSAVRRDDTVGSVTTPDALDVLPPIEMVLDGEAGQMATVKLHARVTEVGTLELSAVEQRPGPEPGRRWKLSFSVRVE